MSDTWSESYQLAGLSLKGRLLNASGTFDALAAYRVFGQQLIDNFPFAAFVTKTVTVQPREGNPPPRIWETPSGMLNSIGLPNKGVERFIDEDLTQLGELIPVPIIVNIMGSNLEEFSTLIGRLRELPAASALELNVSCPNVKTGLDIGADPDTLGELVQGLRGLTDLPMIVKLTPNTANVALTAEAAAEAGADAVSLINAVRGMAVGPTGGPWLGGGTGGISGPAIRAASLAQVNAVRTRISLPIIGMGGVQNAKHARDLFDRGADLVAVGTENFRNPTAATRIAEDLRQN